MYQKNIKRVIDLFISLLLLPILIIFVLPVGIAIKLNDKGKIFYNGKRLGKNLKEFKMFKFRSMKENSVDKRNADGSTYNSSNDTRVTKVGKILRRTSIDEIPQVINVLRGEMSFVGPRPSPLGNIEKYPRYYFKKFEVSPGVTGLCQALLRNNATQEQRMQLDTFYAENISFKLDIFIIYNTIFTVLFQKNIHRN
ncbi:MULTISPECIES: sugar transferase [Staphylococcus]|uniref:sugar transferase n=1 Tax=Staphylococcus TaxID=1279 RepID=UPI0008A10135|nr:MULTISPECIES: sugar transferase [Staphylococcus]MBS9538858.1 sugar transferase [Staphylococcus hominis subsp. novobiosepticus]OFN26476.1 UDP-phosphate galactose phosphotransferase [Staphylococcus sp. HMSC072H03]WRY66034.1 sugar transferase [Staphylococcus hominis]